ncbi:hypothetical protein RB595_004144 [Gaeumannomyces hyphopodioides]
MSGTYEEAIKLLASRSKAFKKIATLPHGRPRDPVPNNVGMREWLAVLGHDEPSRPFDVIHVTGTKGKGGTCAWTDALLRSHFRSPHLQAADRPKVGLYTSPHIVSERERIRIDFAPVSESLFARHFFHVWETVLRHVGHVDSMPGYLQLLALLSAYIFRVEGIAVAVYEVHAGGRFDSTNLWDTPVACGFNTIGLDHVGLLGQNVGEIAWNKAGIMKKGAEAFSVPQVPEAKEPLVCEAKVLGCPLAFVDAQGPDGSSAIPPNAPDYRPELLLPEPRNNLCLAIHLANAYLGKRGTKLGEETVLDAVRNFQWPGRFQVVETPQKSRTRWYLDFAHNDISLPVALNWFQAEVSRFDKANPPPRMNVPMAGEVNKEPESRSTEGPPPFCQQRRIRALVFGHQSDRRETADMAKVIVQHCREKGLVFDHVILAGHSRRVSGQQVFDYDEARKVLELWQGSAGWEPGVNITWSATIKEAMDTVERLASGAAGDGEENAGTGVHALIVGSSHLVSSAVAAMPGSPLN